MLQFYFLSVAANLLAGAILSAEFLSRRFKSLEAILTALSARRARMICGLLALLVGFATLFVPAGSPLILGDLFPSVVGMAIGIALLFEVFRQEALLPSEPGGRDEPAFKTPIAYRTALGALGFAAAILHFFLPERIFI